MKLSRNKIDLLLARKCMSVAELSERYGVTRSRMSCLINKKNVSYISVGKLAKALDVDVTEIIEQEKEA